MTPAFDATSPSLLDRARHNVPGAWERLVELYAPLVYHWCRRGGLGPEHVADFRRDRPGDTFRGWLRTIARNKIRDHYRRLAGQPRATGGTDAQLRLRDVPDPLGDDDPSEAGVVAVQVRRVLESIRGEFEDRTWRAFWAVQMDGRTTDEVGDELGLTPSAVRKAKFRVLRRLREEMGELLD